MNPNNHPENDDPDFLDLSLGPRQSRLPSPPPSLPSQQISTPISPHQTAPQIQQEVQTIYGQPQLPNPLIPFPFNPPDHFFVPSLPAPSPSISISRQVRARRNPPQNNSDNHIRTISPPYPWATDRPAVVHSLRYLMNVRIEIITGMVQCPKCDRDYEMSLDLQAKMNQFLNFINNNMNTMHDRASIEWLSPQLLTCKYCSGDGVKPVISENKDNINWLFLFLGQLLGCCTLEQLKYFCACTHNHRTGAKDRVLYLAYFEIFNQLLRL